MKNCWCWQHFGLSNVDELVGYNHVPAAGVCGVVVLPTHTGTLIVSQPSSVHVTGRDPDWIHGSLQGRNTWLTGTAHSVLPQHEAAKTFYKCRYLTGIFSHSMHLKVIAYCIAKSSSICSSKSFSNCSPKSPNNCSPKSPLAAQPSHPLTAQCSPKPPSNCPPKPPS